MIYNLLISLTLTGAIILPDHLVKIFSDKFHTEFEYLLLIIIFVFSLALSMIKRAWVFNLTVAIFMLIHLAQIFHIEIMGIAVSPIDLMKINGKELFEIRGGASSSLSDVWHLSIIVLPLYLLTFALFNHYKTKRHTSKWAFLVVIAFLSIKPIRAIRKDVSFFYPIPTLSTIHNSLNCLSCYFFKVIWLDDIKTYSKFDWKPYKVSYRGNVNDQKTKPKNIIILLGESLTRDHMGIYGYKRNTTPRLSKRNNHQKTMLIYDGISAGVGTEVSHRYFIESIREPANSEQIKSKTSNLFINAKKAGYKTFFLTSQRPVTLYDNYDDYVDIIVSPDINQDIFNKIPSKTLDEKLINLVDKLEKDFSDKGNFIIINQRSSHFPYAENYINRKEEFNIFGESAEIDAYDNSIYYNDFIIDSLIEKLEKKLKGNSLFVITSDHGQLFGEGGLYKHNHLVPECAKVPMIFYSKDQNLLNLIRSSVTDRAMTHYECAKTLLSLMGIVLENPNEKDGVFYINGSNLHLDFAFIKLQKKGDKILFDERAFIHK